MVNIRLRTGGRADGTSAWRAPAMRAFSTGLPPGRRQSLRWRAWRQDGGTPDSPLVVVRRNQVGHDRPGARRDEAGDPLLVLPVRLGDALVLPQMLEPRGDLERLDESFR